MTEPDIFESKHLPDQDSRDAWSHLASLTEARIALGRVGASMPTGEVLRFSHAHAKARDAVHARYDIQTLRTNLTELGMEVVEVCSAAPSRNIYLRRPDLGRRLSEEDGKALSALCSKPTDVAFVIADGLSATAVHANAYPFLQNLIPMLHQAGFSIGPTVVAHNSRVAIGDEIGASLHAKLVIVLIGERPGLSAADSLGVYITFDPKPGRSDAERNCISNIRGGGLIPPLGASKAFWLVREALRKGLTGVNLKENENIEILDSRTVGHIE